MKRDIDFIRELLLKAEEISGEGAKPVSQIDLSTDDEDKIGYHLHLLKEEGLLEAGVSETTMGTYIPGAIIGLTWQGHEFLENIRNDSIWSKVKDTAKEKVGSASIKILVSLAEKYVKGEL